VSDRAIVSATSRGVGQISERKTGRPFRSTPSGSVVRSRSISPASAYATTSGGEARKFIFTCGSRALEVPVAREDRGDDEVARPHGLRDLVGSGPLLPMQVVQPYPTRWKPSASR